MNISGNQISFCIGFFLTGIALLGLWTNEGRFDYSSAAQNAKVLTSLDEATEDSAIAYTGPVDDITLTGDYVKQFENYLMIERKSEIYCWVKTRKDRSTRWSRGWQAQIQSNERNRGLAKKLNSIRFTLTKYRVGELDVSPEHLIFVDKRVTLAPGRLELTELGKRALLKTEGNHFYLRKHTGTDDLIGDERIRFDGIPATETATYFGFVTNGSGVGRQIKPKTGFLSRAIRDEGRLHHLVNGTRETGIQKMRNHLQGIKWTVRFIGTAITILGVAFTTKSLLHLLIGLPLIGRLTRLGAISLSLIIAITLSIGTIISSWLVHHPLLVLTILIGLGILGRILHHKRKTSQMNAQKITQKLQAQSPKNAPSKSAREERIFQHLVRLAVSDGSFDEKENKYLANWARARQIPDERIVTLFNQAKRKDAPNPPATESEDLYYLISLALADDHLSGKEFRQINRFAGKVGTNQQQLNAIIASIRRGDLTIPTT